MASNESDDAGHKYSVPDDYWEEADEQEEAEQEPPVEVTRHTISIDDRREEHGYEYGLEWTFSIEGGVVTGYYKGHWLEGRTQSDPMRSPPWDDVPAGVKARVREALGLEAGATIPTDLPEFYGGDD